MSDTTTPEQTTAPTKPVLTVVSGNPDDTQVAALTVLFSSLAAQAATAADAGPVNRNNWGIPEERLRRPVTYNPTAFQNVSFY